jgi:ribulose kinase
VRWKNAWSSTSSWRRNPETQRELLAEVDGMAREIRCVPGQIAERVTLPLNPVLARAGMDCHALLVATVGRRSTGYKLDASKLL